MKKLSAFTAFTAIACAALLSSCGVEPTSRVPSLSFAEEASGCGNLYVYLPSLDKSEYLVIDASKDQLDLLTRPKTFDLSSGLQGLKVWVDVYSSNPGMTRYCSDVVTATQRPAVWSAVSGQVTITISDFSAPFNEPYRATIHLENVTFRDPAGSATVTLPARDIKDVVVGWYPG